MRALAGELGRPSGEVGAAEVDASAATRPHPVRERKTTTTTATQVTQSSVLAVPSTQNPSIDAPMETSETTIEPGRDLDVRMAERQPQRRRELEDVEMTAVLAQPASGSLAAISVHNAANLDGWQAELPEKGTNVYGHKSGQPLPEDAVREARGRDIGLMVDHGMHDIVARGAARGKLVRTKWLEDWGFQGNRNERTTQ